MVARWLVIESLNIQNFYVAIWDGVEVDEVLRRERSNPRCKQEDETPAPPPPFKMMPFTQLVRFWCH